MNVQNMKSVQNCTGFIFCAFHVNFVLLRNKNVSFKISTPWVLSTIKTKAASFYYKRYSPLILKGTPTLKTSESVMLALIRPCNLLQTLSKSNEK